MAVNDVYEMAVVYTNPSADGEIANVIHYRQTAYDTLSSDLAMLVEAVGHVKGVIETDYMPLVATDYTFARIDAFILNKPTIGTTIASGTAGTNVGEYLPIRSAPVASKITGLRGRSFRGRMYLLSVMEADQNGGGWSSIPKATMQTAIDKLLQVNNIATTNIWKLTVYSRVLSTPPTIILDNPVSSIPLKQTFGSVRGRQRVL